MRQIVVISLLLPLILTPSLNLQAQQAFENDSLAIKQTVMEFYGWYIGAIKGGERFRIPTSIY